MYVHVLSRRTDGWVIGMDIVVDNGNNEQEKNKLVFLYFSISIRLDLIWNSRD